MGLSSQSWLGRSPANWPRRAPPHSIFPVSGAIARHWPSDSVMGSSAPERVLVTGLGAITPFGAGVEALWAGLTAGRSAVRAIASFDASKLPVRIAAEVRGFSPGEHMDPKAARRMDRFAQFAVAAAREAVNCAGLDLARLEPGRAAVVMNTGG